MRRREFVVLFGGALVARSLAVHAQAAIPHIGYLWLGTADDEDSTKRGIQQGLRDLGYFEGRDIIIDYRYTDGHEERLAALVAELIDAKVAIILSPGTIVTRAVKKAATTNSSRVNYRRPGRDGPDPKSCPARWQHHGSVDRRRSGFARKVVAVTP